MNFKEAFLKRREEFINGKKKEAMLLELNEYSKNIENWDADWTYQDGYFIADSSRHGMLFVLSGFFEPYIFDTLVALPTSGYATEYNVLNAEEAVNIISDLLYKSN
jgi:hypothetical protein